MKCLILAAGYATRLYPLTENSPKPLLMVKGKTIVDWLVDDIDQSNLIDEYVVITNHKYANNFIEWAKEKRQKISVVDDGTISNEARLGAVCDIQYAIDKLNIDDDIFVIAGDNVLDFSLINFIKYFQKKNASCVMRYFEPSIEKLLKCGVVTIDNNDKIINMTEKSPEPATNWCCPPFYFYVKDDTKKIKKAINLGCNTDAPGSLVVWMCKNSTVYAMEMQGHRYDIGNLESYYKVQNDYKGIEK